MMSDGDEKVETQTKARAWGSWEELLLACAVKRHGFKNWESISMELQTKTSLPRLLTTAQCCQQKYHDLKRRFKNHDKVDNSNNMSIPWLEHLRKVRVDELKQDLQRYDLSILSLQLKVKKLEEERDRCLDDDTISPQRKPDLNNNDGGLGEPEKAEEPVQVSKRFVSGEESDRENRSVNGSNSTGLSGKVGGAEGGGGGGELVKAEPVPVRVRSGGGDAVESGWKGAVAEDSEELGDSVTQLSSDVQSSASIGSKRKRSSNTNSTLVKTKNKGTSTTTPTDDAKSQPLIRLLQMIRAHKHASLFERRLKAQESSKYKKLIRQHVDMETIQARLLEEGGSSSYSSSSSSSSCILIFYRDLLLLFNNAIVYFPKASLESETALQLRNLVSIEIKKETTQKSDSSSQEQDPLPSMVIPTQPQPQPKPVLERSDSLLAKHKSSAPIIVCRKRSSVSAKPSSSFAQKGDIQQQQQQPSDHDSDKKPGSTDLIKARGVERSLLKIRTEEKPIITGARSSRRSSRNLTTPPSTSNNKKQNNTTQVSKVGSGSVDKQETPKTDKKKKADQPKSDKKKSVVDFLKRIKKNSPVHTVKSSSSKGGKGNSTSEEQKRKKNNNSDDGNSISGKKHEGKEKRILSRRSTSSDNKRRAKEEKNSPSKRSVGRPPKKTAEATGSSVSGKRWRENVGKEVEVAKRQSKRARR